MPEDDDEYSSIALSDDVGISESQGQSKFPWSEQLMETGRLAAEGSSALADFESMIADEAGHRDESPMAYRRLDEVLGYHEGTIKINHVLKPRVVVMAGAKEVDPYKD